MSSVIDRLQRNTYKKYLNGKGCRHTPPARSHHTCKTNHLYLHRPNTAACVLHTYGDLKNYQCSPVDLKLAVWGTLGLKLKTTGLDYQNQSIGRKTLLMYTFNALDIKN